MEPGKEHKRNEQGFIFTIENEHKGGIKLRQVSECETHKNKCEVKIDGTSSKKLNYRISVHPSVHLAFFFAFQVRSLVVL